ncbi:hypothetical protein GMDG_00182 [Pseudogymnoascus destructans 20631-21]|uniref:HTH CENPB-type domain-containing protein n=1 Tax=Pseudogymnoascus destructans (strain ATCC MYA-4855 / 20631-21) TaxID=658429 RepID=L8FWL0_PSED2|nr:hypothetical protein GMDG_00182 [Pseudogymnoascus destructans 20631-21]
MPLKKLYSMSLEQRKALRTWHRSHHPKPTQKATIHSRFLDLDDTPNTLETNSSKAQRRHTVTWPELEAALYDWQRLIEERGGITTTEILQSKAKIIWNQLPQYHVSY